jgi:Cytochrome P460
MTRHVWKLAVGSCIAVSVLLQCGRNQAPRERNMSTPTRALAAETEALREAYAALNRNIGPAAGILLEGERRSVEVMVKDDGLYKETGGWGFERFDGTSKAGRLTTADRVACFGCHSMQKDRDLVFTSIRP